VKLLILEPLRLPDRKDIPVPRILIVDDEATITEFVSDALAEEGYEVQTCHDGASALLYVREERPDLVLLDITMPVMGGDEVLAQLQAEGMTDISIIVMTASLNYDRQLVHTADALLRKPFTLGRLLTTVEDVLAAA
jgi:CheY-like chemotaxis protein